MRIQNYEIVRDDFCWVLREYGPSKKLGERVKSVTYYGSLKQLADAMVEAEAMRTFVGSVYLDVWKDRITNALEAVSESVERRSDQRKRKTGTSVREIG
jgi:hypothetical protein